MTNDAVLLLGPTGAGKTPLGDLLEQGGLWGRPCRHFDFGGRLRAVAAGSLRPPGLDEAGVVEVEAALETGALLTDAQFPIAEAILTDFLAGPPALVILNGLPRHAGQAVDVACHVDVRWVIRLEASPDVIGARIRANAGGDRTDREDDDPGAVAVRLERFRTRTLPLAAYYRDRGARVLEVPIGPTTTSEEAAGTIDCLR